MIPRYIFKLINNNFTCVIIILLGLLSVVIFMNLHFNQNPIITRLALIKLEDRFMLVVWIK